MEYDYPQYDIVDFAHQILTLHRENELLRSELDHYKKMHEMNCESLRESDKHSKEFVGTMFSALLDPDSVINKGHECLVRQELSNYDDYDV